MGGIIKTCSPDADLPAAGTSASVRVLSPDDMWPRLMRWKTQEFILYVWHKLYKREVLEGLVPAEKICQGEDVLITCQAFLNVKKTVETSAPVYRYYQNPESITHKFGKHDLDLITVWEKVSEIMKEAEFRGKHDLFYMAQINRWRTDFTLITRLILSNDKELDKKYDAELHKWRADLQEHYSELLASKSLPFSRIILAAALRYAYQPTKILLRAAKR